MSSISDIWALQKSIGSMHVYVMGINAGIILFYLLYRRDCFFNIFAISNPAPCLLLLGFAVMPFYYILEAYTTVNFCRAFLHYTCKYLIHHILTISLTFTVFQHSFFNFFTLLTPTVHGLMNLGYYYNPNLEYIMCRWYAALSVFSLVFFALIWWKDKENKKGATQITIIGLALAYNNLNTPELIEMCEITPNVQLGIREEFIHCLGFGLIAILLKRYSKRKEIVKIGV